MDVSGLLLPDTIEDSRMAVVGIDLLEIERVRRSLDRFGERFLSRIFTEQEQRYCNGRAASLAARFAVKEAVAKALGTGIGDVGWRDIEVVNQENGRPDVVLHGNARRIAAEQGLQHWSISVTHTKTQAAGIAVAMRPLNSGTET